jgi:hypothetical protein
MMAGVHHGDGECKLHPTITKDQNCIPRAIDYEDVHKHIMKEDGEKI